MSTQAAVERGAVRGGQQEMLSHSITLRLGDFACEALAEESARLGVSREELASFSVLYYLADLDSGRIARRPLRALAAS
jgi:hypothetical protein